MGQHIFSLPKSLSQPQWECLKLARLVSGYDQAPTPCDEKVDDKALAFDHDDTESRYLHMPWPLGPIGTPVISSATLRSTDKPYQLLTELVRGQINRVRTQLWEWEDAGMELPNEYRHTLSEVIRQLGRMVREPELPDLPEIAENVLPRVVELGDKLTRLFIQLLDTIRTQQNGPASTRIAAKLAKLPEPDHRQSYLDSCNTVRICPHWSAIEPSEAQYQWDELDRLVDWAIENQRPIAFGPVIDPTNKACWPAWLNRSAGDFVSIKTASCDFLETLIARYNTRVKDWQIFSGLNHAMNLGMDEESCLRFGVHMLEAANEALLADSHCSIGIASVWGDYLLEDELTLSPLLYTDTLLRHSPKIDSVEMELLIGPGPRGSQPRTLLDSYRILDLFAMLGSPIDLAVGMARHATPPLVQPDWSWVSGVYDLALSVTQVRSVTWNSWQGDNEEHSVVDTAEVMTILQNAKRKTQAGLSSDEI